MMGSMTKVSSPVSAYHDETETKCSHERPDPISALGREKGGAQKNQINLSSNQKTSQDRMYICGKLIKIWTRYLI